MALIRGIEKGDKDLRHFTFDDEDYVVKGGIYYYKVNYGKNKLEGEVAEDEIGFVECDNVIALGGKKPKPIQRKTNTAQAPVSEVQQVQGPKKRGRPAKVTKPEPVNGTIPVATGTYVYEYHVAEFNVQDVQSLQNELNRLGSEGWELCCYDVDRSIFSATHIRAIFKRKRG